MPMLRAIRLLNAVEAGTTIGEQLEALLADPGRLAEWNVLCAMRGQMRRTAASSTAMNAVAASSTAMNAVAASSTAMNAVAASSTAMNAVAASSTAMNAVAASSTAMNAVAASSTAMNAVIASSTAMNAVIASSTAMNAVWASDTAADAVLSSAVGRAAVYDHNTALAALQAAPAQVQRQVTARGVTMSTSSISHTYVANGTRVILLRIWHGGDENYHLAWERGATNESSHVRLPNGETLGNVAAIGRTTTYANSGTALRANNDNANHVAAANGLRRVTWLSGWSQNVIYIPV